MKKLRGATTLPCLVKARLEARTGHSRRNSASEFLLRNPLKRRLSVHAPAQELAGSDQNADSSANSYDYLIHYTNTKSETLTFFFGFSNPVNAIMVSVMANCEIRMMNCE